MLSPDVMIHLRSELSRDDPWNLERSLYEQARYAAMLSLLPDRQPVESALEVGCAAGVFTERLAARCRRLSVVDVLPEAIARCHLRVGQLSHVRYTVCDIAEIGEWHEQYDVVVLSEVLYYLNDRLRIAAAAENVRRLLKIGGSLVFGSAVNVVSSRWHLPYGAETGMEELARHLSEVQRVRVSGQGQDEQALIVKYLRNA